MNARRLETSQRGAALVVVLAFLILLTIVVLAFYSRAMLDRQIAESTTSQSVVNVLADSATEVVTGNLRAEMLAFSTNVSVGGNTILYPLAVSNAVPARFAGSGTLTPNLVRWSWRGDTVTPALGGVAASPASSVTASKNGRSVSASRWNSHYLLPRLDPSAPDTTPIADFVPPDWVYVTRTGPESLAAPSTNVIGRYAFAIYDEGGLLDANVAGYPSGVSSDQVGEKGSPALADLRALGLPSADALVGWRQRVSLGITNQTLGGGYNFSADTVLGTKYVRQIREATNGFLTVSGSKSPEGATDQRWNTRQALIRFFKTQNLPLDSLQYLGTFSRDLEQPSYRPDPARPKNTMNAVNTGGNSAYDSQNQINPWLLAARTPSGEPRLRRRFALSRIAQVRRNPTPAQAMAIKEQFGLVWDTVNAWWRYADKGDDSKSATKILQLDEIVGEREPDFFEMLKAGIVCDSLGKQHGGNDFSGSPTLFGVGADGSVDYQILQIGAAIIDQYDADSYPTRILFDDNAALAYRRLFFGVEDIPYLYGWMSSWYRLRQIALSEIDPLFHPPTGVGDPLPYETGVLLQPILWNPHAVPATAVADGPSQFEVVAGDVTSTATLSTYPRVVSAWWAAGTRFSGTRQLSPFISEYPFDDGDPLNLTEYPRAFVSPSLSWLRFELSSQATFREPVRLASPNFPAGVNLTSSPSGVLAPMVANELADASTVSTVVMGIYLGKAWTGPFAFSSTTAGFHETDLRKRCLSSGFVNSDVRLELRFRNPDTTGPAYLLYSVIESVPLRDLDRMSTVASEDSVNRLRGMRSGFKADPRSNRWGQFVANLCPYWDARITAASGVSLAAEDSNLPIYFFPQGLTTSPGANYSLRTLGNASGSVPKAPGWEWKLVGSPVQLVGDLMANLSGNNLVNANVGASSSAAPGGKFFYTDPDAVLRRADGGAFSGSEGLAAYAVSDYLLPNGSTSPGTGFDRSRPKILNRPFTSVADLGYAFRGVAWRSLDLAFPESGDSALLDLFCLQETDVEDPLVAGRVNLNTRQPKVIEAVLRGVSKAHSEYLSAAEAERISASLVAWTTSTNSTRGPLRNRSELVGRWQSRVNFSNPRTAGYNIEGALSYAGFSSQLDQTVFAAQRDASIVERRESVMRALTDAGTARTWNLMIDLVAQSGRFGAGAPNLDAFQVQGETRRWIHVAIDRMTGKVLAREVETVVE